MSPALPENVQSYSPTVIRRDITEGVVGLPTMLSFLVVDADTCQPVENAAIDIWHTNASGVYSAPINAMCNPGNAAARTKAFTSDAVHLSIEADQSEVAGGAEGDRHPQLGDAVQCM